MHAVRLTGNGGARDLELTTLAAPEPGSSEALVRVHAAAVTRDELTWPTDRLPAIPSYELSGVVEAVGSDVTGLAAGDEVWALTPFDRDGVAAEYAVVPAAVLAPKPAELSHVEAAALPLPGLSAWQGLVEHGALRAGERVRITGSRGGVGHLAVQIAHSLGATVVDDGAADLLFDTSGGLDSTEAARVVSVAEEPPAGGTYFIVEPSRTQLQELAHLVADGKLRPEIDSVFALADARAAFERLEERGKRGKVVIQVTTFD